MNFNAPHQPPPPPPKTNLLVFFAVLAAPAVLLMVLGMMRVNGLFVSLLFDFIWFGGSLISGIACSLMITRGSEWSSPGKVVLGIAGAIAFAAVSFVLGFGGCLVGASISNV